MLIIFLVAAVICDFSDHRIPNAITLFAAAIGVCSHLYLGGLHGASLSLAGFAVGLTFLLPFYLLGGMGAGDLKMMGAIGAFIGPHATLLAVGVALICGALGGIGLLVFSVFGSRRSLHDDSAGNARDGSVSAADGVFHTAVVSKTLKARFPYALAIAAGGLAALAYLRI
jgi:prepilin peptidase CpaA